MARIGPGSNRGSSCGREGEGGYKGSPASQTVAVRKLFAVCSQQKVQSPTRNTTFPTHLPIPSPHSDTPAVNHCNFAWNCL